MRTLFVSLVLVLVSGLAWADTYPRNPAIDIVHYTFALELSDATDRIVGDANIEVRFQVDGETTISLDLIGIVDGKGMQVIGVSENSAAIPFRHERDKLQFRPSRSFKKGELRHYSIQYEGVPADGLVIADNKHGDRTFSADNWPIKTRHWVPTLDHPGDKATNEFIITAPGHYQVVANGLQVEETNLSDGRKRTHWKQSVPISTWLMVISASPYAVQLVDTYKGIAIESWVFPQDRDAGFHDFANARQSLEFFDTHVGPYSYEKLANIQVTAPVGATEAATAVFSRQDFVTGERTERIENTVAHEIAHHWFGNAVTENDWNDVWLSEGFATYFTLLFNEHQHGRDRFVRELMDARRRVFEFHEENPDYRIVHENLDDMSKVTTSNTYQKGAWVLHMLRGIMGTETFWAGIRDYYHIYRDRTASTDDFRAIMERHYGADLNWFFQQWLYRGGRVELEGNWTYDEEAKHLQVSVNQTQPDGVLFTMPMQIGIRSDGSAPLELRTVTLDKAQNRYAIPMDTRPELVTLDPNHWLLFEGGIAPAN